MTNLLKGRVALITGGGSGIGKAVVKRFVGEGAKVCVLEFSEARVKSLEEQFGENVIGIQGDVCKYEDNQRAVNTALERWGQLDTFVGNAGLFDGRVALKDMPITAIDQAFDELFNVNVKGVLFGIKASVDELTKSPNGTVVLTSSIAAFHAGGGGPLYSASKHATLGLIRQLAHEFAPDVRVNGVAPGVTATDLTSLSSLEGFRSTGTPGESPKKRNPLNLTPDPEHHAGAYVFLASNMSKTLTGTVLPSDGGMDVRGLRYQD
ncbi:SDR family NAD(P)-dependent oxidoreductase [Oceanobacillus sp. 143]|uniref:3-(Cis-5,6-dihydroxycyclohexa-1, 3-dien-1-yl)propanoate dehydrogenase n=1 Tax=Oceanobacillus zhaokaii TaxID=2052660 RepID=A0A345PE56_9BACI|nr:SDR family NAD(P)-dependent oxidoreductase [Oceanobacillus zhaokaii]AXI08286.1 3-(cis-5,6-dihydroxycyclohexa-1,3-dien-1-yl)propanoate dehydrogenase [Oceanobacillus zhaokaii]QGS68208.1 SDR family NAD(P)-dependent oxidoreductase [Oceanobacillus sp. 143]